MADRSERQARRIVGGVAVGAAIVSWWPAFTLGAWGGVFFEQILTLWAAATAAFVVLVLREGTRRLPRIVVASLLLPSLWIALAFLPTSEGGLLAALTTWSGVLITLIGFPFMVWVILQVTRPQVGEMVSTRAWVVAGVAVVAVAVMGFGLGRLHPYFLTCGDFKISGNAEPANCTPGERVLG